MSVLKPPKTTLQLLCASLNSRRLFSPCSFKRDSYVTMEMKALDSDSEFGDNDDFNSNELNDDFDDEHDSEEEEEDGEEVGEEEKGDWKNDNKDAEMEELEKEYMNLRHQEQDVLKKDLLQGQAVKNQKALWDKALEFRFLLQKAFSCSHGIMDYHR